LDRLLAEIDTYKTKGYGEEVYWSKVSLPFKKVMLTLTELRGCVNETKIPFHLRVKDYLSDRSFVQGIIVTVIALLVVALIIYLVSILTY
jgi:hypothetical protein